MKKILISLFIIALVAFLISLSIPAINWGNRDTPAGYYDNNLRLTEHAKSVWEIKNKKTKGEATVKAGSGGYIDGGMPAYPEGGNYTINPIGEASTWSYHTETTNAPTSKPSDKAEE